MEPGFFNLDNFKHQITSLFQFGINLLHIIDGDLAHLGALRDVSWRQHEALPGMLAKRGMQGGAVGLVAYVLYRLLSPRAVRS